MKRLCFLLPDADSAHGVVDDLRAAGIGDLRIYVVANEETPLGDMPPAGVDDTSDFYPQLERGMAFGGTLGVIGGLVAMRLAGGVLGGGAVLLLGLLGAGINGVLAAMAGAAFPNSRLEAFEAAIRGGHVLVMVDVDKREREAVTELVKARHPELEIAALRPHTAPVARR